MTNSNSRKQLLAFNICASSSEPNPPSDSPKGKVPETQRSGLLVQSDLPVGRPVSYLIGLDDKPGAALLAASLRDVLVRIGDVCTISGLSVPTIYRLMTKGLFPRPVKIT